MKYLKLSAISFLIAITVLFSSDSSGLCELALQRSNPRNNHRQLQTNTTDTNSYRVTPYGYCHPDAPKENYFNSTSNLVYNAYYCSESKAEVQEAQVAGPQAQGTQAAVTVTTNSCRG